KPGTRAAGAVRKEEAGGRILRRTTTMERATPTEPLRHYLGRFARLHRNASAERGKAPHKPVLPLAGLHLIQRGVIRENRVPLSPDLVAAFRTWWRALVPADAPWQERVATPFRHLAWEGWWELVKGGATLDPAELGNTPSLALLQARAEGGRF